MGRRERLELLVEERDKRERISWSRKEPLARFDELGSF